MIVYIFKNNLLEGNAIDFGIIIDYEYYTIYNKLFYKVDICINYNVKI